MATTHVDRHGDRLTVEALQGMAEQAKAEYVPVLFEHDIRLLLGRVARAEVVELADGEAALEVECEYWEEGDTPENGRGDGRTMRLQLPEPSTFTLSYDHVGFEDDEAEELRSIARLSGSEAGTTRKKAADPFATIVITAGAFAAGAIATSFFSRLGADLYDALKEGLQSFLRRVRKGMLLDFHFTVLAAPRRLEVHIIVDRPKAGEIASLFDSRLADVDRLVLEALALEPNAARIVLEWKDGHLERIQTLRDDVYPIELKTPRG